MNKREQDQKKFAKEYKDWIDNYFKDRKKSNESFIKALGDNFPEILDKLEIDDN